VKRSGTTFLLMIGILLATASCGYRVASRNRLDQRIQSIHVLPFENETSTFRVEQILTRAVIHGFVRKSGFEVAADPARADAVFQGVVSRVTANPVIFGQETFGSTFLVTLDAKVEVKERSSGEVLFQNDRYIFREQYVINVDVENFFSELNPALERIAEDFASSVVAAILEQF